MVRVPQPLDRIDRAVAGWMHHHGLRLLRYALGLIFVWFGILKPLGVGAANDLVAETIEWAADPAWAVPAVGWWEVAIGVCLLIRPLLRLGLILMGLQMIGAFLPMVILPGVTWKAWGVPSLHGQYIIKDLVLLAAGIVLGGTVRRRQESTPREL